MKRAFLIVFCLIVASSMLICCRRQSEREITLTGGFMFVDYNGQWAIVDSSRGVRVPASRSALSGMCELACDNKSIRGHYSDGQDIWFIIDIETGSVVYYSDFSAWKNILISKYNIADSSIKSP